MPGINFIADFKGDIKNIGSEIKELQNSLPYINSSYSGVLLSESHYFIGYVGYNSYPITTFETNQLFVYIEGIIYNKDNKSLKEEIEKISEIIFLRDGNATESIKKWLLDLDGDFIILILDKTTNNVVILNDALGRLSLYFYKSNERLLVSRNISFITPFVEKIEFNSIAIAEYLLLGYPLGEKTLLKNIFRLQPATLIKINPIESKTEFNTIHTFNFDYKINEGKTLKENVDQLNSLFLESCKNRANCIGDCKNVVSLSGGLDSRSVLAGLKKCGIAFSGATYLDSDRIAESDARLAEFIAKNCNIDWKLFKLDPPKGKDYMKLLKIKNGLNYLGMSFILPFFNKINETYGSRVIYFTGDGGDKVLPDLTPGKKLEDIEDLVDTIIRKGSIFALEDLEVLIKINQKEIKNEIKKIVEKYPEKDLKQKYVHFLFYERAFKWLFEGEDRNRYYFWSVAPFYSIHVLDYAMNCPSEQKKNHQLYLAFLSTLYQNPPPIKLSYEYYIYNKIRPWVRKKIKKRTKIWKDGYRYFQSCILDQIDTCNSLQKYFSIANSEYFIKKSNSNQLYNLFTIISYIELTECGRSTLENYINYDFF